MDIKPSRPAPPVSQSRGQPSSQISVSATANRSLPPAWQVNSLIEAVVLQKTIEGKLILDLKGIQVEVADPPPLEFEKGQRWLLQLMKRGPLPVFKLLHPIQNGANETISVQQALRTVTPKQQPMPPLLANVHAQMLQINTADSPLPRDIQQAIQNLYSQIPQLKDLQQGASEPQRLREIMQRIAPVLESELAALSRNEPSQALSSVRTRLLRLAAILQSTLQTGSSAEKNATLAGKFPAQGEPVKNPAGTASQPDGYPTRTEQAPQAVRHSPQAQPQAQASLAVLQKSQPEHILFELAKQVEGALARGQVQQLHSLHSEQQSRPMWAMELPLRTQQGIDLFDLRIERDKQQGEGYSEVIPWSVTLAFDLHGLGPVRAIVSLRGDQISTHFWAEHPQTNLLFNQHLDWLHSQLNHAGINVGKLECLCGSLPEENQRLEPVLLDEKV